VTDCCNPAICAAERVFAHDVQSWAEITLQLNGTSFASNALCDWKAYQNGRSKSHRSYRVPGPAKDLPSLWGLLFLARPQLVAPAYPSTSAHSAGARISLQKLLNLEQRRSQSVGRWSDQDLPAPRHQGLTAVSPRRLPAHQPSESDDRKDRQLSIVSRLRRRSAALLTSPLLAYDARRTREGRPSGGRG
jgi:hypothetical protein